MRAVDDRVQFVTPFRQYAEHSGRPATVVRVISEPDSDHDAESLPMFVIRFDDGVCIEAWEEELVTS